MKMFNGEIHKNKIHISIYVRNKYWNASGYYRITQYLSQMSNSQIVFRELVADSVYYNYHFRGRYYDKVKYIFAIFIRSLFFLSVDNIRKPDVVIINREICPKIIFPLHFSLECSLLKKTKVIWDFDDFIYEGQEISKKEWDILKRFSDKIVVLEEEHKKKLGDVNGEIYALTTTDGSFQDIKGYEDIRRESFDERLNVVWVATSSSLGSLEMILPDLERLAKQQKDRNRKVVLYCVCNKPLRYIPSSFKIINIKWTRDRAIEIIKGAHVGIMPLADSEFSRGKGGFKIIQYMAAGLPVVASPVGINQLIVDDGVGVLAEANWDEAISLLCDSWSGWQTYSSNARKKWETQYSYNSHFEFWKAIIDGDI